MHKTQYRHYMRRIDDATNNYQWIDIEDLFPNLIYMSAKGLYDVGKPKNIYTEEYADSDRKRVFLPKKDSDYTNEGTEIKMTFIIIGPESDRMQTLNKFVDYVRHGIHSYYDTARMREFDFIVADSIEVSDEKWHGSTPYVEITIPMQNLNGSTRLHV